MGYLWATPWVHSGQTSEICKSWAKYFKVKVATFTIESLGYYQHPVSLLNFLKVYEKSSKWLKTDADVIIGAIFKHDSLLARSVLRKMER